MNTDKKFPTGSIVFWDQYFDPATGKSGIGGIERLIANLISGLGKTTHIKLIAYESSIICDLLQACNTPFQRIDPKSDLARQVQHEDLHVSFGTYRNLVRLKESNPRILLWRVYPDLGLKGMLSKCLAKRIMLKLDHLESLVFMDLHCRDVANENLGLALNSPLLRIPIEVQREIISPRQISDKIRISYVGRGSEIWKVKPVKRLLSDLCKILSKTFELHIFTDTDHLFQQELASIQSDNVSIQYHFGVYGENLKKALYKFSDLHYSMGTACLEGAALGIPTLIADASHHDFPEGYRYRWLKDDIDHYAGTFIDKESTPSGLTFDEVLSELSNLKHYSEISTQTLAMIRENFMLEIICNSLLRLNSQARVSDILKYMPNFWITRMGLR